MEVDIQVDGHHHHVTLEETDAGLFATVDGERFALHQHRAKDQTLVAVGGQVHALKLADSRTVLVDGRRVTFWLDALQGVAGAPDPAAGALGPIKPPMTGTLAEVSVNVGDTVSAGDVLFVLEAMKMRNEVHAPAAGVVSAIHAKAGQPVEPSTMIMELSAAE